MVRDLCHILPKNINVVSLNKTFITDSIKILDTRLFHIQNIYFIFAETCDNVSMN